MNIFLASWDENEGNCLNEIRSKLGYQLELKEATFSKHLLSMNTNIEENDSSADDQYFSFTLKIKNNGYASPINRHHIQIVLRHVDTGEVCAANAPSFVDIRDWFGGSMTNLSGNVYLPMDMTLGLYEVLLHVTDHSHLLRNKIDYKIKFANDFLNEEGTGLIKLLQTYDLQANITHHDGGIDDWKMICGSDVENEIIPPPTTNPLSRMYLANGGFEDSTIDEDWKHFSNGYEISGTESHSGLQSIFVRDGAAKQVVKLNANAGSVVKISGYSKSIGVSANLGSDYSIYTDVELDSGYLWGQNAIFPGGTLSNWTYSEYSFTLDKYAKQLSLYTMYRNDPANGLAFFDDIQVTIDGVAPVTCPVGYYESESNPGECYWCPMGFACSETKIACNNEYFSTGGADSCNLCPGCNGGGFCVQSNGVCKCPPGRLGFQCEVISVV